MQAQVNEGVGRHRQTKWAWAWDAQHRCRHETHDTWCRCRHKMYNAGVGMRHTMGCRHKTIVDAGMSKWGCGHGTHNVDAGARCMTHDMGAGTRHMMQAWAQDTQCRCRHETQWRCGHKTHNVGAGARHTTWVQTQYGHRHKTHNARAGMRHMTQAWAQDTQDGCRHRQTRARVSVDEWGWGQAQMKNGSSSNGNSVSYSNGSGSSTSSSSLPPPFGTQCVEPSPSSSVCMCTTHRKSPPPCLKTPLTPHKMHVACQLTCMHFHKVIGRWIWYKPMGTSGTMGFIWYHMIYSMVMVYLAAGMVCDSTGAVWQKLTCSIPVLNPTNNSRCGYSVQQYGCSVAKADPWYTCIKPYKWQQV
jgi:hypothetical protein